MGCTIGIKCFSIRKPDGIVWILIGLLIAGWILPAGICAEPGIVWSERNPTSRDESIAGNDTPGTTDYPNGAMVWMDALTGTDNEDGFPISLSDPEDG